MTRGYLRDSGGAKRLRFVKPGYDADSEDVPPNKVIFDSKDIGTLSILDSGQYTWPSGSGTGGYTTIATWDYDFVPLCAFQFDMLNNGFFGGDILSQGTSPNFNNIIVGKTGIVASFHWNYTATVTMRWQAYRLAAA